MLLGALFLKLGWCMHWKIECNLNRIFLIMQNNNIPNAYKSKRK
jgi:hypothetical protein